MLMMLMHHGSNPLALAFIHPLGENSVFDAIFLCICGQGYQTLGTLAQSAKGHPF